MLFTGFGKIPYVSGLFFALFSLFVLSEARAQVSRTDSQLRSEAPNSQAILPIDQANGVFCLHGCKRDSNKLCRTDSCIVTKNHNPLDGVNTYDLVLISKHILGLDTFDTRFQMIAADANKSNTLTTFDVASLRKLILGIFTDFSQIHPKQKSWRFVDTAIIYLNQSNPFQTSFPEIDNCFSPPSSGNDFTAIKIGDVNNTVVLGRPAERPVAGLSWPAMRTRPGDILTVPIRYSGTETMEAKQLGLRFDPNALQLIGPSLGDIETYLPDNFNLLNAESGEIRSLWFPMYGQAEKILPGIVLFNLSFRVKAQITGAELPLWLDDQLLDCTAWKTEGSEYVLQQTQSSQMRIESRVANGLTASIHPNPASGQVTLQVEAPKADKLRIAFFDAFGQQLFLRETTLQEGRQEILLPETAALPAGVYIWNVYTPSQELKGHLVKQ